MGQIVIALLEQIKRNRGFIKKSEPVLKIEFNSTRAYVTTSEHCFRYNFKKF